MIAPFLNLNDIGRICAAHHEQGVGVALATGCFDIITRAHVELLEQASMLGVLFVGINTDESVRKLKGPTRPINKMEDRAYVLSAFRAVKIVFPIDDITVASAIREVRPKYWIKGGDYSIETLNQEEVAAAWEVGAEIVLITKISCNSTTAIISKL